MGQPAVEWPADERAVAVALGPGHDQRRIPVGRVVAIESPLLWHTARQCGLSPTEAEDTVQQTFLMLVRRGESIADPLAVVRWLTVTLRRQAWRDRSQSASRAAEEPTEQDLPRAPSAEHAAVLTDEQRRLWAHVSELSERCRRLLAVIAFAPRPDYAGGDGG